MDTQEFDFGVALSLLRANGRLARKGWNGKGMFLVLVPGSQGLTVEEGRPLAKAGVPVGTRFNYLPHIDMYTAQGDFVPWLASQTDLLAQDWVLLRDTEGVAQQQLRRGDIVRLKSGGPDMTVIAIVGGDEVVCTWQGKGSFHAATLVLAR